MSLVIPFSKEKGPKFRQVYTRLRDAILSGVFQQGEKLPSTRDLAEQLGISRTVVLLAFDQLLAEGYAVGQRGSGTYVSSGVGSNRQHPSENSAKVRLSR